MDRLRAPLTMKQNYKCLFISPQSIKTLKITSIFLHNKDKMNKITHPSKVNKMLIHQDHKEAAVLNPFEPSNNSSTLPSFLLQQLLLSLSLALSTFINGFETFHPSNDTFSFFNQIFKILVEISTVKLLYKLIET